MKPFEDMAYHPLSEQLVGVLRDHTLRDDPLFFRVIVGYFFALAASQMRCVIMLPEGEEIPTNLYALTLAPSGFGKTKSTQLLEEGVLGQFRSTFMAQTFPNQATLNMGLLADRRALINGTDPQDELRHLQAVFKGKGSYLFSFNSGTAPAVKDMRNKLLIANTGSLNLIMDEVGNNLSGNLEVLDTFIELFDKGVIKQKLLKNTKDNVRDEEILGKTPANLLMFGTPAKLFDNGKTEDEFMMMLESGYARRWFFAYIRNSARRKLSPEEMYDLRVNQSNSMFVDTLANKLENLANEINLNKKLTIERNTFLLLNEYQIHCEERADRMPERLEVQKHELTERSFKVLKLAGAYAFIDDVPEITQDHIENAIKLAEDSGKAFHLMLSRDQKHVKLAKYIADVGADVTHADLAEDLPFYRGSQSVKADMLTLATAWGYKNNIIIKKSFSEGIEFLRGEALKETDLSRMIVSYSKYLAKDYVNETPPFNKLYQLTQAVDEHGDPMHWVSHHLRDNYRDEEHAIPGFNLVVIDIDGLVKIETAKELLHAYTYLIYTTKRHTDDEHRFRLIMPINYELKLDARDYKEFMENVFNWLPFTVKDNTTNQRARKWLTHPGQYWYNDGLMLDALPFIPKTSRNEQRKALLNTQQSMDNLERWILNNTGDGNRNNMLHRYAMVLVDNGLDFEPIRQKVMELNDKLVDKLDEVEIMRTVMITVARELSKR